MNPRHRYYIDYGKGWGRGFGRGWLVYPPSKRFIPNGEFEDKTILSIVTVDISIT
jgi:hypothetical protein